MKKILFIICAIALSSCSSYNYSTISNNQVKGDKKYKTYAFLQDKQNVTTASYADDQARNQIVSSTSTGLKLKGLTQENNSPDLLVRYTAVENTEIESLVNYAQPVVYNKGRGVNLTSVSSLSGNLSVDKVTKSRVNKGLIIIDLIDQKTDQLLWSGRAEGGLTNKKQTFNDIPLVVANILKDLPPLD